MACVDELRAASVEGHAQELAGCRGLATVVEEGLAGLLGQGFSGAAGATGGIDQQSGHQGRVDVVAYGAGDRQVQGVGVEAVVVGVPGGGGGGDQCAGEGELRGFAGGGDSVESRSSVAHPEKADVKAVSRREEGVPQRPRRRWWTGLCCGRSRNWGISTRSTSASTPR
ncbi:hypothetical protein GCM10010336_73380 [Streptomyces goshikiensis]|nr:hypothetical protein GCM10010336_73380 [Streptomyces goshikiensis]